MVPFAGWDMPVQYEGVIQEHRAVREDAGAFDVSHMGEIEVEGPQAREPPPVAPLERHRAPRARRRAVHAADERAGRDRRRPDRLRARPVPVPADRERVEPGRGLRLAKEREVRGSDVRDVSDEYGLIAVQGPNALERLGLPKAPRVHLRRGRGRRRHVHGQPHRLHRRGGRRAARDGRRDAASSGTRSSSAASPRPGSARATACASRSATRCTATTSARTPTRSPPGSAGSARSTPTSRAPSALREIKEAGPEQRLAAFVMEERAVPRQGMPILEGGEVTSGHALADARLRASAWATCRPRSPSPAPN